jgi:hypothetical protein
MPKGSEVASSSGERQTEVPSLRHYYSITSPRVLFFFILREKGPRCLMRGVSNVCPRSRAAWVLSPPAGAAPWGNAEREGKERHGNSLNKRTKKILTPGINIGPDGRQASMQTFNFFDAWKERAFFIREK